MFGYGSHSAVPSVVGVFVNQISTQCHVEFPSGSLGEHGDNFLVDAPYQDCPIDGAEAAETRCSVMSHRRLPALVPFYESKARAPSFGGERFREKKCRDWLGYYDWLRNDSGECIGLRLHLDDPADIDLTHLNTVTGVDLDLPAVGTR